ncbi:MAG: T9SS type A sorting domain-containing protein [Bacteroidota bacterium]
MYRSINFFFSLLFLLTGGGLSLSAQTVFTKIYNNHLVGENIEWDAADLMIVGTVQNNASTNDRNFGFMKVDTLGNASHAIAYSHDVVDRLQFIRIHPDGGYVMGGYTNHYNSPDSAYIAIIRTHANGVPIWARKYRRGGNFGGELTGMEINGDGRIAFTAYTRGPNIATVPGIQGSIVMLDTAGHVDWHRHVGLGNMATTGVDLGRVHNNLSIDNTGHLHTGWNFVQVNAGDTIRGFTVRKYVSNGLLVWSKQYKADRLMAMSLNPFFQGVGLYLRDSAGHNGFVSLDFHGNFDAGFLDAYQAADGARAVMKWNNQQFPYLFNNRYTPWQQNPATILRPSMSATTNSVRFHDFAARGDQLYLLSKPISTADFIPVLTRVRVDTIANCFLEYSLSNNYAPFSIDTTDVSLVIPSTAQIHQDSMPLLMHFLPHVDSAICVGDGLVWPGDANSDGIANVIDLIYLGLAWGNSGPARVNPTIQWIGQFGLNWSQYFFNGANHKHADANGNGHVGIVDLLAILANYGLTHNKNDGTSNSTAPPLYLEIAQDTVGSGDTITAFVMLGDVNKPVQDLSGLAFSVTYDPQLIDSASMTITPVDGWFGMDSVTSISLQKDFHEEGRLEAALTRTDQSGVSGFGPIAMLTFITIDNISGKQTTAEQLYLEPKLMAALDIEQQSVDLHACSDSIIVYQEETTGIEAYHLGKKILLYPNPTQHIAQVFSPDFPLGTLEIWTVQGQLIQRYLHQASKTSILVENFAPGVYILKGKSPEGRWFKKLLVE